MFAFGIVGFLAGILSKYTNLLKTKTSLCVFGGLATLFVYGIIMNISTVIQYQAYPTFSMMVSYCIMGIPFDVVHALSTVFFLWLISDEMLDKLERLKTKYKMYSP